MEKFSPKTIAEGTEKEVTQDPHHLERVVSTFKHENNETPRTMKARFYLTNILHLLMPDSIPEMHWAGSEPNRYASEKIQTSQSHQALNQAAARMHREPSTENIHNARALHAEEQGHLRADPRFQELQQKLNDLGISFDRNVVNFSQHPETGEISYLDHVEAWRLSDGQEIRPGFDKEKVTAAIAELSDGEEKTRAEDYLQRLLQLLAQEQKMRS